MTDATTTSSVKTTMSAARFVLRVVVALAILAAAVLVWLHRLDYRGWEAWAAAQVTHLVAGSQVLVNRPYAGFYVDTDSPEVFGLTVTSECTSVMVTIGLFVVTAILLALARVRPRTLLMAASVAIAAFFAVNIVRIVAIALATQRWTDAGFRWSHEWAGTFVTVFGGVGVCALYLVMLFGRPRRRTVHQ